MKHILAAVALFSGLFATSQKPVLVVPRGHAENISKVLVTPDGKYLASGAWDKTVRLWDMASGKELLSLERFPAWVRCLAFSPDSRWLAAGGGRDLRILDLKNGGKLTFQDTVLSGEVNALAFSTDGKTLVTADALWLQKEQKDRIEVKVWSVENGFALRKRIPLSKTADRLLFLSNGDILVVCSNRAVQLSLATGAVVQDKSFSESDIFANSPDGRLLVTNGFEQSDGGLFGGNGTAVLQVKDRQSGATVATLKAHSRSVKAIAFSADGDYLATGADDASIIIWDLKRKEIINKLDGFGANTYSLAFSVDDSKLVSGNTDNIIRVWDFRQKQLLAQMGGVANTIASIDIDPLGSSLAIAGANKKGNYLSLFDLRNSHTKSLETEDQARRIFFNKDGEYLVAAQQGGKLDVFNTATGVRKLQFDRNYGGWLEAALSPDGRTLAISNDYYNATVKLYNFPEGDEKLVFPIKPAVRSLAFSADGEALFVGAVRGDQTTQVSLASGKPTITYQHGKDAQSTAGIAHVLPLEDGKLLTADDYGHLRWWDATGKETGELYAVTGMNDLRLMPGNRQIAVVGGNPAFPDPRINVVDLATRKIVRTLTAGTSSPSSLAVTPNGKFLFSGSYDRTIRLWDLAKGEVLATIVLLGKTDWVIVDKDGRFDGTQEGMRTMYYTQGLNVLPLESGYEQFYTPNLLPRLLQGESFTPPPVNIKTLKLPPAVTLSVEEGTRNLEVGDDVAVIPSGKESVTIKVKAECPQDAVTEIRLYQNGKLVQTTRNLEVADDGGEKTMLKNFAVTLSPGENRFRAVAFNTERTESRPAEIAVRYTGSAPTPQTSGATLHLVVVGINQYKNPKYNLNYAGADASGFRAVMEKGGDLFADVKTTYLADAGATKEAILGAFKEVVGSAKPQDVFIFYYAGHGVMSSAGKKDFYIVLHDVTQLYGADDALAQKGISSAELQELSKNIPAQKQLFILDACQSAGALEGVSASRGAAEEKAIAQLARSTGTHWLTASGSDQFAAEFSQLGHGIFTYVLLQALTGGTGSDSRISVNGLKAYLEAQVPELSQKYKGAPQYPASYGYGNDFPIRVVKE